MGPDGDPARPGTRPGRPDAEPQAGDHRGQEERGGRQLAEHGATAPDALGLVVARTRLHGELPGGEDEEGKRDGQQQPQGGATLAVTGAGPPPAG